VQTTEGGYLLLRHLEKESIKDQPHKFSVPAATSELHITEFQFPPKSCTSRVLPRRLREEHRAQRETETEKPR
jgi:hypothetical protein